MRLHFSCRERLPARRPSKRRRPRRRRFPSAAETPASGDATPAPAPLPPAGVVPPNLSLEVTGNPGIDGDVLDTQIRAALNRAIRPTLRPGSAIAYGPIVPWPLLPLAAGERAAVNVTVTIEGDSASAPVQGVTTVTVENVLVPPAAPKVLFLSDDPEYLWSEGLVFRGDVGAASPARLYYYQSDLGSAARRRRRRDRRRCRRACS